MILVTWGFLAVSAWAGPTLHLIGDSTMADKPKTPPNPETGWGQALPRWLSDEVLCADKTGTITEGSLAVAGIQPIEPAEHAEVDAALAALAQLDPDPNATSRASSAVRP